MTGLLLSLALVALVGVAWLLLRDTSYRVEPPATSAPRARPGPAAAALQELAAALDAGDPRAAAALAAPEDGTAATLLSGVARNARLLRLDDVSMRYVDETGPVGPDGSWQAVAELTWRLGGERAASTEVAVGLVQRAGRVSLASLGGGGRRTPVWLAGPVRVVRTPDTLLLVSDRLGRAEAGRYAGLVAEAGPQVRRTVTDGLRRLVVEVPAGAEGVDAALDAEPGTYRRVAAVTGTADGSTGPRAPVRVLVNPEEMARLGRRGAQVVMTHEAAHVALGAATSTGRVPPWLVEGTADYVALRDLRLPFDVTLRQALARVRREGPPPRLPGPPDFDTVSGEHLGTAYELSWLACLVIAERAGPDGLLATYRDVEAGVPLDRALGEHAGTDLAGLTERWRRRLVELAG